MTELAAVRSSPLTTLKEVVKTGAGFIADLFSNLVAGIQGLALAPLALAIGCQSATEASNARQRTPEAVAVPADANADQAGPRQLGLFNITFYYVIREDEVRPRKKKAKPAVRETKPANDNHLAKVIEAQTDGQASAQLAAVTPPELVSVYGPPDEGCEPIAEVSREFAQQLRVQGTGKLRDGRVLNVWGHCECERSPCFQETRQQWGTAGTGRPLHPFRTVAVDPKVVKLGSLLYIPMLEGRTMPGRAPWGGFVHDGCVVADDTGGAIRGKQLDFFVGRKGWWFGLSGRRGSHAWARHVPVFDGSKLCERRGRKVAKKSGAI